MEFFPSRAIAFSIGPVAIHWYGVMYAIAFLLGSYILPFLLRFRSLTLSSKDRESLLFHLFFGVIFGGRLGYVLLYGFDYYRAHPATIFAVWEGGMSSHGGFVGVMLVLLLFSWRHRVHPLALADVLMVPVALGLALGRVGNLLNGELYGTVTTVPWAMQFPDVSGLRHPTQVYAIMKDVFIASVCFVHLYSTQRSTLVGRTASYFLMLYAVLRFIVEIFRDQPFGYIDLEVFSLSLGQLYTIPVFILGMILWLFSGFLFRHKSA